MNAPVISVIIPFYNRREYIDETIGSVRAQTFTDWEALIVDDGSTDGSFEYVRDTFGNDPRIRILQRTSAPKGASHCRNIGIRESRGKYLMFLDSDDLLAPTCLERRVRYFEKNSHCDFLVFNTVLFKENDPDHNYLWNVDSEESDLCRFLRQDVVWPTPGPVHRKEALLARDQWFDENLPFWQDFEFHTRYLFKQPVFRKFLHLEPDNFCRRHNSHSISQKSYGPSVKRVQRTKEKILDSIYRLINNQKHKRKDYKTNLAYNYIMISEDAFRYKLILFSYRIFTRLWLQRFITLPDYIYLLVKQPLTILKIKNSRSPLLDKWEHAMKNLITKPIMFPHHQILQVKHDQALPIKQPVTVEQKK